MAFQEDFNPFGGINKSSGSGSDSGGGDGGDVFYVTFAGGDSFPPQYTADKTFDEITNAFNNNQMIVGVRNGDGDGYNICNYKGKEYNPNDSAYYHVFANIWMYRLNNVTYVSSNYLRISSDNIVTFDVFGISKADE